MAVAANPFLSGSNQSDIDNIHDAARKRIDDMSAEVDALASQAAKMSQQQVEQPDHFNAGQPSQRNATAKSANTSAPAVNFAPPKLAPLFEASARKYKVPVNVLMALGAQESRFETMAEGQMTKWGRAKGIMQYIDSTAAGMGINPFDPAQSIDAAAKQIAERMSKGYSVEEAIAAHHGGDNRKQWGEKTEQYVQDVLGRSNDIKQQYLAKRGVAAQASQKQDPAAVPDVAAPEATKAGTGGDSILDTIGGALQGMAGMLDNGVKKPGAATRFGKSLEPAARRDLGVMGTGEVPDTQAAGMDFGRANAPVTPEAREGIKRAYEQATPQQREKLLSHQGWQGSVARQIESEKKAIKQGAMLPRADGMPGLEQAAVTRQERVKGYISEGLDKAAAERSADADLRQLGAGAKVGASDFDFEGHKEWQESNSAVRAGARAGRGLMQAGYGTVEFLSDLTGAEDMAAGAKLARQGHAKAEAIIGKNKDAFMRPVEDALTSIATQVPLILGGAATGSAAVPLAGMFVQTFGQEYGTAKDSGLSMEEATARASIMGAFEVIGETMPIRGALGAIKAAAKGIPLRTLPQFLSASMKDEAKRVGMTDFERHIMQMVLGEQAGELVTHAGQYATTNLINPEGRPNWTLDEYLTQAGETFKVALIQSVMMGGGTAGAGIAINKMNQPSEKNLSRAMDKSLRGAEFNVSADEAARSALDLPELQLSAEQAAKVGATPREIRAAIEAGKREAAGGAPAEPIKERVAPDLLEQFTDRLQFTLPGNGAMSRAINAAQAKEATAPAVENKATTALHDATSSNATPINQTQPPINQTQPPISQTQPPISQNPAPVSQPASPPPAAEPTAPAAIKAGQRVTMTTPAGDRSVVVMSVQSNGTARVVDGSGEMFAIEPGSPFQIKGAPSAGDLNAAPAEAQKPAAPKNQTAKKASKKASTVAEVLPVDAGKPVTPEATTPEAAPAPAAKAGKKKSPNAVMTAGDVVTVNSKEITLTPEQAEAWNTANAEHQDYVQAVKSRPDNADNQRMLKGRAMKLAATRRQITGALTAKEQAAAAKNPPKASSTEKVEQLTAEIRMKLGDEADEVIERAAMVAGDGDQAAYLGALTDEYAQAKALQNADSASMPKSEPKKSETSKQDPADVVATKAKAEEKTQTETAKQAGESAKSGTQNTADDGHKLVTTERYNELRERLKAKLNGSQLNSGIDPEILAIGTEMAVYHIEGGARKFADFARKMAEDLGTDLQAIRPFLRSWYNGARDMTEDMGGDTSGTESPEEVKASLAALFAEPTAKEEAPAQTSTPEAPDPAPSKASPEEQKSDGRKIPYPRKTELGARKEFGKRSGAVVSSGGHALNPRMSTKGLYQPALAGDVAGVLATLAKSKSPLVAHVAELAQGLQSLKIVVSDDAGEKHTSKREVGHKNQMIELAQRVGAALDWLRAGDPNAVDEETALAHVRAVQDATNRIQVGIMGGKMAEKSDHKNMAKMLAELEKAIADSWDGEANFTRWRNAAQQTRERVVVAGSYRRETNTVTVASTDEHTLAHEFLHAITVEAIDNPTEAQKPAVERLHKLYKHVTGVLGENSKLYGLKSIHEFVAEGMSNPEFQYELAAIPYERSGVWGKFVKAIAELLGIAHDTSLHELMQLVDDLALVSSNPESTAQSKATPAASSTAPEHATVGVDERELSEIVEQFNNYRDAQYENDDPVSHIFDKPKKQEIIRMQDKVKVYHAEHGWMTPDEAKAKINEWREHAQAQGEDDAIRRANSQKIVLSLFDLSGAWSKPWAEAGYQVWQFDIQDDAEMGDVNNFSTEFFADWFGDFDGQDIHAILAACPCTDFASSGSRHFAAKDADGRTVASVKLVQQTLATIEYFKPAVWAIENPVGRIEKLGGLPPWRLSFDPNHIGEDYTKKTLIWGRFNGDLPIAPTEPTEGSKMHRLYGGKSLKTKNARSVTPEGFAYSFFMANNAHDHPVMALANVYDRLDRDLIAEALDAGATADDIKQAVDDPYYMDLDDDAAQDALRELIAEKREEAEESKQDPDPAATGAEQHHAMQDNAALDNATSQTGKELVNLRGTLTDEEIDGTTDKQMREALAAIRDDHYRGMTIPGKDIIRRLDRSGELDIDDARKVLRMHRDYWNKRGEDDTAADARFTVDMDRQYGAKSILELSDMAGMATGRIASLQQAGAREMDGNGGRRTSAAASNEAARAEGEERMRIERYARQREEAARNDAPDYSNDLTDYQVERVAEASKDAPEVNGWKIRDMTESGTFSARATSANKKRLEDFRHDGSTESRAKAMRRAMDWAHVQPAGIEAAIVANVEETAQAAPEEAAASTPSTPTEATPAVHVEEGKAEKATAPVIAASIAKGDRNRKDMNRRQIADAAVFQIDQAIAEATHEDGEFPVFATPSTREISNHIASGVGKDKAEVMDYLDKLHEEARKKFASEIGYVTIDVPGDGKFKVLRTKKRLQEFRKKLVTTLGARDNVPAPRLGAGGSDATTLHEFGEDGEMLNALELLRIKGAMIRFASHNGKGEPPTLMMNVSPVDLGESGDGFEYFVGQPVTGGNWIVTEAMTGYSIGEGASTKAGAISVAKKKTDKLQPGALKQRMNGLQDELRANGKPVGQNEAEAEFIAHYEAKEQAAAEKGARKAEIAAEVARREQQQHQEQSTEQAAEVAPAPVAAEDPPNPPADAIKAIAAVHADRTPTVLQAEVPRMRGRAPYTYEAAAWVDDATRYSGRVYSEMNYKRHIATMRSEAGEKANLDAEAFERVINRAKAIQAAERNNTMTLLRPSHVVGAMREMGLLLDAKQEGTTTTTAAPGKDVKYTHPENGMTWTGRGRKPVWVQEWIDNGGTIEQLEINKAEATEPAAQAAQDPAPVELPPATNDRYRVQFGNRYRNENTYEVYVSELMQDMRSSTVRIVQYDDGSFLAAHHQGLTPQMEANARASVIRSVRQQSRDALAKMRASSAYDASDLDPVYREAGFGLPYELTPKQYHAERVQAAWDEYGKDYDGTRAEFDEGYPYAQYEAEWVREVRNAAKAGKEIPRQTLDRLVDIGTEAHNAYTQLVHDIPNAKIPEGYRPKWVRDVNAKAKTERIADSKQIAEEGKERIKAVKESQAAIVSPDEFPTAEVDHSYSGISHSGTTRARRERDAFVDTVLTLHAEGSAKAETPAQMEALNKALAEFKAGYIEQVRKLANVRSGVVSSHVAGRNNFNSKQANKRGSALDKAEESAAAWMLVAKSRVIRAVKDARSPEQIADEQVKAEEAATEKANAKAEKNDAFMRKIIGFVSGKGFKMGDFTVVRINKGRDGYPKSLTFTGEGIIKGVSDKVELVGKRAAYATAEDLRNHVDRISAEMAEAAAGAMQTAIAEYQRKMEGKPVVELDGNRWYVLNTGAKRDGKTYAHLASVDQGDIAKNGFSPRQMADYIDDRILEGDKAAEATEAPKAPAGVVEAHDAVFYAAAFDEAVAVPNQAQMLEQFDRLVEQAEDVKAQLAKETKDKLAGRIRGHIFSGEKKADLVRRAYTDMLGFYGLMADSSPVMVTFGMGEEGRIAQIRKRIADSTDAMIAEAYVEQRKRAAKYAESFKEAVEGMKNPQTIADFRAIASQAHKQGKAFVDVLTPEQLERADDLIATESKAKAASEKAKRREVRDVDATTTASDVIEAKHTKHGHDLFVVQLVDRVERDQYDALNTEAKRLGGSYSSFRGRGAVPGFQFRTREAAQAFREFVNGDSTKAKEVVAARRDAFEDDKQQSTVERLREMADSLEASADAVMNADRKTNTARRAAQAASSEAHASGQKAFAKTMRNIADGIAAGNVRWLDGLRTKTQLSTLQGIRARAVDACVQANRMTEGKHWENYEDIFRRISEAPPADLWKHAAYPTYTLRRSDVRAFAKRIEGIEGFARTSAAWLRASENIAHYHKAVQESPLTYLLQVGNGDTSSLALFSSKSAAERVLISHSRRTGIPREDVADLVELTKKLDGKKWALVMPATKAEEKGLYDARGSDTKMTLNSESVEELLDKVARYNKSRTRYNQIEAPYWFADVRIKRMRLQQMDINDSNTLRMALRELETLKTEAAAPDRVKQLERALVGRKGIGIDFFPTPASVADDLVNKAEIEPGMSVLEPSAGNGNIADAARRAGFEPSVVEQSSTLREILEAKGYEIAGNDFMEVAGSYDRIVMNPPFSNRLDAEHVRHAFDLLKPGGRLVAIMGEGVFFGQDKKATEFREWLEELGGVSEQLPEGTFLDASLPTTTGVAARVVTINKPSSEDAGRYSFSFATGRETPGDVDPVKLFTGGIVIARKIGASFGIDVLRVVPTFSALPAAVQKAARDQGGDERNTKGVFDQHTGLIYIVADVHTSLRDVEETVFHELNGHYAFGAMMGKTDKVRNKAKLKLLQRIGGIPGLLGMARRFGIERSLYSYYNDLISAQREKKFPDWVVEVVMIDELFAHMAERLPFMGFAEKARVAIKRIIGAVRGWLRDKGFKQIPDELSDGEFINLIHTARKKLENGGVFVPDPKHPGGGGARLRKNGKGNGSEGESTVSTGRISSVSEGLSAFSKFLLHPRHIAALRKAFTPVYETIEERTETRDQMVHRFYKMAEMYFNLPPDSRAKVDAALELSRLSGSVMGTNTVQNTDNPEAQLSMPGETISLTGAEMAGYRAIRKSLDAMLDEFKKRKVIPEMVKTAQALGRPDLVEHINADKGNTLFVLEKEVATLQAKMKALQAEPESEATKAELAKIEAQQHGITEIAMSLAELDQVKRTGYVPFSRYGDVVLTVKGKDDDGKPFTIHSQTIELPMLERKKASLKRIIQAKRGGKVAGESVMTDLPTVRAHMQELKRQFAGQDVAINVMDLEDMAIELSDLNMAEVNNLARVAGVNSDEWEKIRDQMAEAIRAKGYRRHFFSSKLVPGYDTDFERSISNYILSFSGYMARDQYAEQLQDAVTAIKNGQVRDYAKRYVEYVDGKGGGEEFARWRAGIFLYYIAGVPASAVANMTQPLVMTLPALGQFVGLGKATVEIARAAKDAARMFSIGSGLDQFDPSKAPEDARDALSRAWEEGAFIPLSTHEAQGFAYNRSKAARGTGRKINEVIARVAYLFSLAERFNRLTTFIAALRIGRGLSSEQIGKVLHGNELAKRRIVDSKMNVDNERFAHFMVDDTQFRMGKINRPEAMRGIGAPLLQFKGFMMQSLEAWYRLVVHQDGARMALTSLAIVVALAGVWGIPFADDFRKWGEAAHEAVTGERLDLKTGLRELVTNAIDESVLSEIVSGKHVALALDSGIPMSLGYDMRRLGMGNVLPNNDIYSLLGMPGDVVKRAVNFVGAVGKGDAWGAAAAASPNFIKNPVQGASWMQQGVRTQAGREVVPARDVSIGDALLKATGTTPVWISEERSRQYALASDQGSVDAIKRRFNMEIARAMAASTSARKSGDEEGEATARERLSKIRTDIVEWNKGKPKYHQYSEAQSKGTIKRLLLDELGINEGKKYRKKYRQRAEGLSDVFVTDK